MYDSTDEQKLNNEYFISSKMVHGLILPKIPSNKQNIYASMERTQSRNN